MKTTKIQWCHSTVNPVIGCDGCELWPSAYSLWVQLRVFIRFASGAPAEQAAACVNSIVGDRSTSEIYRDREQIAAQLCARPGGLLAKSDKQVVVNAIRNECVCYAGLLGTPFLRG